MGEENVNVLVDHVGTLPLKLVFEQLWVAAVFSRRRLGDA